MPTSIEQRFWPKVDKNGPLPAASSLAREGGPCWLWKAGRLPLGYGRFYHPGGTLAHRFSYELACGPIPDGLSIDHLCRIRHCVNPAHLEPVTAMENNHRGESPSAANLRKTACANGHPFTDENTYVYCDAMGRRRRSCRECNRLASLRYKHKTLRENAA